MNDFNFGWNDVVTTRCSWCGLIHSGGPENCKNAEAKQEKKVAQKKTQSRNSENGSNGRDRDQLPFLKVEDINKTGTTPMIVLGNARSFRTEFGDKFCFDVKVNNKKYAFTIKPTNPGFRVMLNKIIAGQDVEVYRDTYNNRPYVAVDGVDESGGN